MILAWYYPVFGSGLLPATFIRQIL